MSIFFLEREKYRNKSVDRRIISTRLAGKTRKEKRNNGRNGGVGNHRCIGNCTLPVHDSFITHEFITTRLTRNRYQLGKRFRRKAIVTIRGEKKYGDDRIIHSGKNWIIYLSIFFFLSWMYRRQFVFARRESGSINIPQQFLMLRIVSVSIC